MAPALSVTLTKRFTSFTSMRKVVSWAGRARGARKMRARISGSRRAQEIPSGAKAPMILPGLMYGLKAVPFTKGVSSKAVMPCPLPEPVRKRTSRPALGGMGSLRRVYRDGFRKGLACGPHYAIHEGFLLPDGDRLLEGV